MIITGDIQPWHVYVTSLGLATVQAFQLPSRSAMISDSVPPNCLTNAMGLNAVVFNSARSAGPALAGVLIALYGTAGSYSIQALFYLLATVWTIMLRPEQPTSGASRAHAAHGQSFGRNILARLEIQLENYEVASACWWCPSPCFCSPFTTLLPVFARDILRSARAVRGYFSPAWASGALFSSVRVAFGGDRMPRGCS